MSFGMIMLLQNMWKDGNYASWAQTALYYPSK